MALCATPRAGNNPGSVDGGISASWDVQMTCSYAEMRVNQPQPSPAKWTRLTNENAEEKPAPKYV